MTKINLEEFAYSEIKKMILKHHFQPGEILLETQIAEQLKLNSRTPVHYALGQLVANGFLDKKIKKGCYIRYPTPEDAEQVFSARNLIEIESAKLAAINASDQEIEELGLIIDNEANIRKSGDLTAYASINEDFHNYVAKISKNKYLQQFSEYIFWRSNVYIIFFHYRFKLNKKGDNNDDIHTSSTLQHLEIFNAIKNRKPEEAAEMMHKHVCYTSESIW